ncbi:MAG: hypothetical protein ACRCW2_03115 [Cellulosilyticaceae bacterium]
MPFLFYRNQSFTLVSHKAKQGLFYQIYTKKGFFRPVLLHNFPTTLYAATISSDGTLHVVSQTTKSQVTYFKILDAQVTKQVILDDVKGSYNFAHLAIHSLQDQVYLFYTALHPSGNTRSLMCQILTQDPTIYTLIPQLSINPTLEVFSIDDTISVLYLTQEDHYILRHITINHNFDSQDLLHSQLPLTAFNMCRAPKDLHLVYLLDNFGRSQLVYVSPTRNVPVLLRTAATLSHPCIFYFLEKIWVTYVENGQLYTMVSMDGGLSFSEPVLCSLQSNLDYYAFSSSSPETLNASSLYASLLNTIRLPIIVNLDTKGIHPDLPPNTELELLLEGLKFSHPPTPPASPTPPMQSNPFTTASHHKSGTDTPQPSTSSTTKSIRDATKAFMNQIQGFDATPKD